MEINPNSETTPEITVFCMTYLLHLRFIRADPDLGSNRRRPEPSSSTQRLYPRARSSTGKRYSTQNYIFKRYVIQNTVISVAVSLFGFISIYLYTTLDMLHSQF